MQFTRYVGSYIILGVFQIVIWVHDYFFVCLLALIKRFFAWLDCITLHKLGTSEGLRSLTAFCWSRWRTAASFLSEVMSYLKIIGKSEPHTISEWIKTETGLFKTITLLSKTSLADCEKGWRIAVLASLSPWLVTVHVYTWVYLGPGAPVTNVVKIIRALGPRIWPWDDPGTEASVTTYIMIISPHYDPGPEAPVSMYIGIFRARGPSDFVHEATYPSDYVMDLSNWRPWP